MPRIGLQVNSIFRGGKYYDHTAYSAI